MDSETTSKIELMKKAAIAAVLALLATEEGPEPEAIMVERANAWGMQGRSQSMEFRNLMQLRSIGRR